MTHSTKMKIETIHQPLTVVKEEQPPRALILGGPDFLACKLSEKLKERGCEVARGWGKEEGRADYIFILEGMRVKETLEKVYKWGGRFIITFPLRQKTSEELEKKILSQGGQILRINTPCRENADPLVDNLLKQLFQGKGSKSLTLSSPPKKTAGPLLGAAIILIGIFFLIGLTLLPVIHFSFNFYKGFLAAKSAREKILKGFFEEGKENLSIASTYLDESNKTLGPTRVILNFLGQKELSYNLGKISELTHSFLSVGRQTIVTGRMIEDLGKTIAQGEEVSDDKLANLDSQFDFLERELSFILSQIKVIDVKNLPIGREELDQISEEVGRYRGLVRFGKDGLSLLPEFWGFRGRRTYLILLQNNMELRPTGGFIGSYGLLTLDRGKIVDFKIEDIYTADGQLKGHVPPPPPIAKYLDQPHWFLRDVNWDPDFSATAQKAEWFLDKELKVNVDGVLAIDLSLVKEIIGAFGEVYLPDYQVSVTAEDFFLKTQDFVQRDFFPGSTQKKDFLGSLTRQIFLRLESGEDIKIGSLLGAIKNSLEEKHFQMFLNNKEGQEKVERFGWGGRLENFKFQSALRQPAERTNDKCLEDYLMIVEANLGVNKANYFLTREIEKEVFLNEKEISTKVTINYENESPNEDFPAGKYKNYLRVYLPPEVNLEKLSIDDQEIGTEEIDKEGTEDLTVFGIFLEVPTSSKKKISFEFSLLAGDFENYQLLVQKQAGTEVDPFLLKISYPREWQTIEANFSPVTKEGSLIYQTDMKVDRIFRIKFRK